MRNPIRFFGRMEFNGDSSYHSRRLSGLFRVWYYDVGTHTWAELSAPLRNFRQRPQQNISLVGRFADDYSKWDSYSPTWLHFISISVLGNFHAISCRFVWEMYSHQRNLNSNIETWTSKLNGRGKLIPRICVGFGMKRSVGMQVEGLLLFGIDPWKSLGVIWPGDGIAMNAFYLFNSKRLRDIQLSPRRHFSNELLLLVLCWQKGFHLIKSMARDMNDSFWFWFSSNFTHLWPAAQCHSIDALTNRIVIDYFVSAFICGPAKLTYSEHHRSNMNINSCIE